MRPPLHSPCTFARLLNADRMPLCRRSMLGRILESKHISHIDVESASRACDPRRGRGRAREALARGRGRFVSWSCSARRRPARKPPMHALCRCACVSGRVPSVGFHNYIVIFSNARGLRPYNSRSIFEFPENAVDIAPSRHVGCAERNGHGDGSSVRIVDRASTLSSYGMGEACQGSNSPEAAADTRI